jgi:two-component system OmpR family response regulator
MASAVRRHYDMHTMRLLVVEDEDHLARLLRRGLAEEGYAVDLVGDAARALASAGSAEYDAAVLDIVLPDLDGFEVCTRLRRAGWQVPVLMLTARDSVSDRIRGLDAGADDYLCKPFSFSELCARIRALIRRSGVVRGQPVRQLRVGEVRLDPISRRVWSGPTEVYLSTKEFVLLELLMHHHGQALERARILELVWGTRHPITSNVVDQYVRYLRNKLGQDTIETVRGIGYRMASPPP